MFAVLILVAIIEGQKMSSLNHKSLFLTVLESGCLKSGYQHSQVLSEGPFPGLWMAVFSLYSHMAESSENKSLSHVSS